MKFDHNPLTRMQWNATTRQITRDSHELLLSMDPFHHEPVCGATNSSVTQRTIVYNDEILSRQ
jgi:hypothetical protein